MNSYQMTGSLYSRTTNGVKQKMGSGNGKTRGQGDKGTGGQETSVSLSPCPLVSPSPCPPCLPFPSLPLLRFRARFAVERVMRQEPVALQPDDDQVAGRQFHVGCVPLVACDYDGKAVNLRVINQREGARLLRIRLGLGGRGLKTRPQHESRNQPFTVADVGNVFDHGPTESVWRVE